MHLLVFYTVDLFDELEEEHIYEDKYILVNAPEDLLQSEFTNYVFQNYYDDIYKIEQDCYDITINNVIYVSELNNGVVYA